MSGTTPVHATGRADAEVASARVAVLRAARTFAVRREPRPQPGEGQIRFAVEGCGVCGSDLAPWRGASWFSYPFAPGAPGHEAWGVVDAVGPGVRSVETGQRVAALGFHGYAEYDVIAADAVVRLPPDLRDVPFPAEPIACAMNVLERSRVTSGETVVIIGIGFLGALLTRLASTAGARVIAASRRGFALDVACEMGADRAIALTADPAAAAPAILEQVNGDGATCVFEAVGRQDTLDLATAVTATRGRLIIAGYHQDGPRSIDMQRWNWRGLDVINAHERDPAVYVRGMREAVAAVASGRIPIERLITHRFDLDRLNAAMRMQEERPDGFLKAMVTP